MRKGGPLVVSLRRMGAFDIVESAVEGARKWRSGGSSLVGQAQTQVVRDARLEMLGSVWAGCVQVNKSPEDRRMRRVAELSSESSYYACRFES